MHALCGLVLLAGGYPLVRAWYANRYTTLRPTLGWATAAWAAWLTVVWGVWGKFEPTLGRYLALSLTGCAGVAVLGARRPGVGAWNFVVVGLLAVLLRPLWEGLGELHLGEAHLAFLAATVVLPLVNYLPTRPGPAAAALAAGAVTE